MPTCRSVAVARDEGPQSRVGTKLCRVLLEHGRRVDLRVEADADARCAFGRLFCSFSFCWIFAKFLSASGQNCGSGQLV